MGINDRTTMFFGAKPLLFERAKHLRENMTPEERLLWGFLKNKENTNCHFRCQHPIYQFIADFYCHTVRLVIEVDGGIHLNADHRKYDICRDYELSNFGITVCRFTNDRIHNDFESVKQEIVSICAQRISLQ
jgi:very-short-patch-repair endonuclease